MKKCRAFISFISVILYSVVSYGQEDSILYELNYKTTQTDPSDKVTPSVINSLVLISKKYSVEKNLDKFKADTAYAMQYTNDFAKANPSPSGEFMNVKKYLSDNINEYGTNGQILYDYERQKYLYFKQMFQKYYYEVSMPTYKWKLTDVKQSVAGYQCRKAEGTSSRGAEWEVWYCESYQVPYNLYGIVGLNGLIIKAVEKTSNTIFELTRLSVGSKTFKRVEKPNTPIMVSKKEMEKLEGEFAKDRVKFLKEHPFSGTTIKIN